MKRIFAVFLLASLLLSVLCACGSKRMGGISDRAYELGSAALENVDEYIAGRSEAKGTISQLELADLLLGGSECDGDNDTLISGSVGLLKIYIENKQIGTGTMEKVKSERDRLADMLGK